MMRLMALALLAVAISGGANEPVTDMDLPAMVDVFQRAEGAGDSPGVEACALAFESAVRRNPQSGTAAYWHAVAEFHGFVHTRYSFHPPSTGRRESSDRFDRAWHSAQNAGRILPDDAEIQALLCVLYGIKSEGSAWRALWWGPRVMQAGRRALAMGEDNPRVRYLLGTCRYFSAKSEKDYRDALEHFKTADMLFRREAEGPRAPLDPRWGRPGALMFLGRTLEQLNQTDRAAAVYEQLLVLQPLNPTALQRLADIQKEKNPHE